MAKSKYTNLVCILVILLMLVLTVLLMNGEKLGIRAVDRESTVSGYTSVIQLQESTAKVRGKGAAAEGNIVKITSGGQYTLTGVLNGSVYIETKGSEDVILILDGATVNCPDGPAVLVQNTGSLTIRAKAGSENTLLSTASFSEDDSTVSLNAAVYSEDDLILDGDGSLTIQCTSGHGISAKDKLLCKNGTYIIESGADGLRARDRIEISGGTYTVTAGNDAIKSKNDLAEDMGNIEISGGTLILTAQHDGIQSANGLAVTGGEFTVTTGTGAETENTKSVLLLAQKRGGEKATLEDTGSHKGLKASGTIEISGGQFALNCEDDAIHSDSYVYLSGGEFTIKTGDDAVHANDALTLSSGKLVVETCYEGLEAHVVTVTGGEADITSNNDAITTCGESGGAMISLPGGTLKLTARGDAIDSDLSVEISGGEILAFSENVKKNRPLEYESGAGGTCRIEGGTFLGFGGGECRDCFDSDSTQKWSLQTFDATQKSGTVLEFNGLRAETPFAFDYVLLSGEDMSSFLLNNKTESIK